VTPEQAAELRKPFAAEHVGKLPRVWCKACRESQTKNCQQHTKIKCDVCKNTITKAHLHLDYVGHAEITDRLLLVDPEWTWEPVAFGQDGLPVIAQGGLWIRLTVAGVTRLGFGSADGKIGPDAKKEAIGDAIRNAAMRFGVALDLWGAKFKGGEDGAQEDVDPVEEQVVADAFADEIRKAKTYAEIEQIGTHVKSALTKGELTKAAHDRLGVLAGTRAGELNGGGGRAGVVEKVPQEQLS